jgi:hypothetical protein
MSNSVKTLGEAIRARREAKLLTQYALASEAGIKIITLRNVEVGRTEQIRDHARGTTAAYGGRCRAQPLCTLQACIVAKASASSVRASRRCSSVAYS